MTNLIVGGINGVKEGSIVHFGSAEPLFENINPKEVTFAETPFLASPNEWHAIHPLSSLVKIPKFLRNDHCFGDYPHASRRQFHSLKWLASYQSNGVYLQRVASSLYETSKIVEFQERAMLRQSSNRLKINEMPDAVYFQSEDLLIFRNPRALVPILESLEPHLFRMNASDIETFMTSRLFDIEEYLTEDRISRLNLIRMSYVADFLRNLKFSQRKPVVECLLQGDSSLFANRSMTKILIESEEEVERVILSLEEVLYRQEDRPYIPGYNDHASNTVSEEQLQTLLYL